MRAMVLERPGTPLVARALPDPEPGPGELVVAVAACGVCRTDLHIVDGELAEATLPLVPGHPIVAGERVGVAWLGWACGHCDFCRAGRENLCARARFTGYHSDGGYAERVRV